MAGFEPTTSTSQMWRDTGLRYIPNFGIDLLFNLISKGWQRYGFYWVFHFIYQLFFYFSGEGGIRTRGTVTSTTV